MGAAASIIALHPTMCSAAAAVCPPVVGVAAGVFGVGVALGATAAVCPPVGIAAIFVAGVDGEMDHHRAAHQLVVSEAALFDVACSSGPGGARYRTRSVGLGRRLPCQRIRSAAGVGGCFGV